MERFREAVTSLIEDEGVSEYLIEAAEASETVEDFKSIAVPLLQDLDETVSSEEEADALAEKLFNLLEQPEAEEEADIHAPITVSNLLDDDVHDIFEEDRMSQVRKTYAEDYHQPETQIKKESNVMKSEETSNNTPNKIVQFRRPEIRHPRHIHMHPINVHNGPINLIENATLTLSPENRYGLVGRNGIGKTTFLHFVSNFLIKGIPDDLMIIHVEQEAPISERSVLDSILDVDIERTELLAEYAAIENSGDHEQLKKIRDRLDAIGASEAESRASMILVALGFTNDQLHKPLSSMSGGLRMRVSLAQALYINPDILLLDEPTGHLDAPSVCWLEEFLSKSCTDQILIVVSHDRIFLDNVCTHIIHLKDKDMKIYSGNYSQFEEKYINKSQLLAKQAAAQQKDIDHKMDFVRRLGAKAAFAAIAHGRKQLISKMEIIKTETVDPPIHFEFQTPTVSSQENLIVMQNVHFAYVEGENIFENLSFTVTRDTRAVVIGANGAGKSTMLKLLMGKLQPEGGFYQIISNLRVAHFSQHHVDQLDYNSTPIQFMLDVFKPERKVDELRGQLGKFGIDNEKSMQRISSLSGGQKTRVVLAACALRAPHLLLLDEVTNNLDMESIQALGEALSPSRFNGAIVAVTHDQHFANLISSQIYICDHKNLTKFDGTFQDYRNQVKKKISEKFFSTAANRSII